MKDKEKIRLAGNYPAPKNKRPLTAAKDKLRNQLAIGKFRQFRMLPDQVDSISVEKLTLLPPE